MYKDQSRTGVSHPTEWVEIVTPPPATPVAKKPDEHARKQIVQTERGQKTAEPPKDSFLGEHNQEVDRETVSRRREITMGSPREQQARHETEQTKPAKSHPSKSTAQTQETQPSPEPGKPEPAKPELKLSALGAAIVPLMHGGQAAAPPEWEDVHNWAEAGSMPEDYVKGIKESEKTALNTKEYVFFGYFQRIRERLDRAWVPILRDRLVKMFRMGRQLASDMDHITQVLVVLNNSGEIIRVTIVSQSGTRDLDEAAVRAFNQAGPFPNPPRGIVDPNGEIQIPWQFILRT